MKTLRAPLSDRPARERAALKGRLDRIYATFDGRYLDTDPLSFAHRYGRDEDREVVAFLAAGLAFGNVVSIRRSLEALFGVLGPSPARFADRFDPGRDTVALAPLYHRWIRGADLAATVGLIGRMRAEAGSIGGFFEIGHDPSAADIGSSLVSFTRRALALAGNSSGNVPGATVRGAGRVDYFFPSPAGGSACKRLNLFLRWMVRGGDGLDLGLWPGVARRQLVLPLDTHLARLARALRLSARRTPDWIMAVEATRSLALFDPDDPVKYDFSLSRLGILDLCLHGLEAGKCPGCPVPRVRALARLLPRTAA